MRFATTSGERSVEELAARIFGTKVGDPETRRAANALVRSNPQLRRIDELPPTVVAVPDVRGIEPGVTTAPLPSAATGLLLRAVREHAGEIEAAAKDLAHEGVQAARSHRKELQSAELKRRARADKRFAAWLKEADEEAKAEIAEARALEGANRAAFAELGDDLEALLEVLGGG
jgi:hypothetical protein